MRTWVVFSTLISTAMAVASMDYLYKDDPDANAVIEHTSVHDFEKSSKARLVEFYSPVSVSSLKDCSIVASNGNMTTVTRKSP